MAGFKLRAKARADLKRIAVFTQRRRGTDQRNKYLLQFDEAFHKLAENMAIGRKCDYIRPGYRKYPIASHVIYHKTGEHDCVEIIRILHKHMDVSSALFGA
jgi:toxin ParE1/3/4